MHCGLPRVGHLQDSPARARFLSIETLLEDLGEFSLSGISWAIVAGESGPGARPMQREWVISVRDLCRKYHVPFFFKQCERIASAVPDRAIYGLRLRHSEFVRLESLWPRFGQ